MGMGCELGGKKAGLTWGAGAATGGPMGGPRLTGGCMPGGGGPACGGIMPGGIPMLAGGGGPTWWPGGGGPETKRHQVNISIEPL